MTFLNPSPQDPQQGGVKLNTPIPPAEETITLTKSKFIKAINAAIEHGKRLCWHNFEARTEKLISDLQEILALQKEINELKAQLAEPEGMAHQRTEGKE